MRKRERTIRNRNDESSENVDEIEFRIACEQWAQIAFASTYVYEMM